VKEREVLIEDSDSENLEEDEEIYQDEEHNPLPFYSKIHEMKMADWNKKTGLFSRKGNLPH
jgi:hypothetical protein